MKLTSFLPLLLTALPLTLTQPTSLAPTSPNVDFNAICDLLGSLRPAMIKITSENNTSSDHDHHHHHQVADFINQGLGCEDKWSRGQLCDVVDEVFKTLGGGKEEKGKKIADKVLQKLKEVKGENLYAMLAERFNCGVSY